MDALTQAMECCISLRANPVSDALALEAMHLVYTHLPAAVASGDDLDARGKVGLGSLLQAMAFANAGVGAVHALAHPLGAYYGVPHGRACAVILPHVLEYNLPSCEAKMRVIARTLSVEGAEYVPRAIRELLERVGIPPRLGEFGIEESMIPELIAKGRLSSSMKQNPRTPTDEDLGAILRRVIDTTG
jgi:alcohol dehydrogenase class IV